MGMSLKALRKHVSDEDRVLVTIVTDVYENASSEYDGTAIKALVEELKAKGGYLHLSAQTTTLKK